jgi:hypothetical protein
VLPFIVITLAYLPAIVFVGLAAFAKEAVDDLPTYAGYYGIVFTAVVVFVTFVAPEALCPDRRNRLLGQYLAGPVSRSGYLVAKVSAVMTVLLVVTLGPQLLLLAGLSLEGAGPDGVDGFLTTLGRIVASGVAVSAMLALVALAIASFTDRIAFAAVGVLVFITVTGIATGALYNDGDGATWAPLLSITALPEEVVLRIFGVPAYCTPRFAESTCDELVVPELSSVAVFGAACAWVLAAAGVLWSRYRSIEAA